MKRIIHISFIFCLALSAFAQDDQRAMTSALDARNGEKNLRTYDWRELQRVHPFPDSEIISMDGMPVLKIENTNQTQLDITLLEITNSSIIKKISSAYCEMKFKDVFSRGSMGFQNGPYSGDYSGASALQCLAFIPSSVVGGDATVNNLYYPIAGSQNWSAGRFSGVVLANENLPEKIKIELVLNGPGTVYLRPIKLFELKSSNNWWPLAFGVIVGGLGGALFGCCGALIGCLAAMGKARRFVLTMTKALIALGIIMTIAGIAAVICRQPYAVYYPLILLGGVLTFVFAVNLYPIKRRYDDLEIRRMTSMDVNQ